MEKLLGSDGEKRYVVSIGVVVVVVVVVVVAEGVVRQNSDQSDFKVQSFVRDVSQLIIGGNKLERSNCCLLLSHL